MALIWPFGLKLTDSSGNALSGAKLRVYTANTTTLANLYSDAALTQAISNPVIAQSDGMLANGGNECAVYVAAGTYDIAILSSADAVLDSVDDYVPWGGESGDIDRTVTGNGRFKVTGSAGAVLIQAGDPSPDNVGGTLTIEGQAATQLDSLTLDAALVNATGRLKENSKKVNTVQTEATSFSGAATVDIALPNSPTGVRAYRVTIYDLTFANATQPRLRLSYGSSLKSGASDYSYVVNYWSIAGSAFGVGSDDAAAYIDLHGENFNGTATISADKVGRITLDIVTPNSGTADTLVRWSAEGYTTSATPFPTLPTGSAHGLGGYGRCDAVRLLNSAGVNMTGKYVVEALAGFGD